jgi:glycosyltransferase involved in cell wall biosynthesis
MVSRLVGWLKLDGLRRAIAAADRLAARRHLQLVIVGGGSAESDVARRAAAVNARHGRRVVAVIGPLVDPRPAYEVADVMISMGGSALRSMAFAKPTIVVGERGFSAVLEPASRTVFDHQGFYGIGSGRVDADELITQLERLLDDAELRAELGRFGRDVAVRRYSLPIVGAELDRIYRAALAHSCAPPLRAIDTARSLGARMAAIGTQRLPGR